MKKFIFIVIIIGVVATFLFFGLSKALAQEKLDAPKVAKAVAATEIKRVVGKGYLAGSSRLTNGIADIVFKNKIFASDEEINVVVTPVNSWSAIYVTNVTTNGFTVKAETGNTNAEFNWIAVSSK